MKDVADWLTGIGFAQYADRFVEQAIDLTSACDLTEDHLRELGVRMGHRQALLHAIDELRERSGPSSERRQLSVMFCDVVGSSVISRSIDPEDLSELMRSYHDCV